MLETKLHCPPLPLLPRPAPPHPAALPLTSPRRSPVGNIFNMRRIKCLSLAKAGVGGGRGLPEGPIFSHSFTAGGGGRHTRCLFTAPRKDEQAPNDQAAG